MNYYDLNPEEVKQLWYNASCKKDFMEQIGITNRDYRALKRVLKFYNINESDLGLNLVNDYKPGTLRNDKTGQFFGSVEVLKINEKESALRKRPYYECYCHKCNSIFTVRSDRLREGKIDDCGCVAKLQKRLNQAKDYSGQRFGDLIAININIEETAKHEHGIYWDCECQRCGNSTTVWSESLTTGNTTSCGCKFYDKLKEKRKDISHQRFGFLEPLEIDEAYTKQFKEEHPYFSGFYWKCFCHNCNKEVKKPIRGSDLVQNKRISCGCLKRSYGEIKIEEILKKYSIPFIPQYKIDELKGVGGRQLSFDFAIVNNDNIPVCFIEFNGRQHYEPIEIFGGEEAFKKQQNNDKIKQQYCNDKNIKLLSIPYYEIRNIENIIINVSKDIC